MGEEALEFVVELGGQSLVVGHDEGGAVGSLDDFGGGESFTRSGDAEQDLMLFAVEDAAGERVDGARLVALGSVAAYQLEVHNPLYGRGAEWLRMLPANSLVSADTFWTVRLIEMDEVYHDLLGAKALGQAIFVCRFVAQDHNFGGT